MLWVLFLCSLIAVFLLVEAIFAIQREKQLAKRLKGEVGEGRGIVATLKSWAVAIGNSLGKQEIPFVSKTIRENSKKLRMAGITNITGQTFFGIQVLSGIGFVLLFIILLGVYDWLILLLLLIIGYMFPSLWLNEKIKKRHMQIFKGLPDALDILTLLVEAGLDFGAALNILIENEKGPLIDELAQAQQEIRLGANRIQALTAVAKRVNYRPLTSVINALVQSMQTGAPIGSTLRALSDQYRTERAQLAEKLGAEAPLKMMLPLIILIFPTIFIIIFGPIVLSFLAGRIW